MLTPTLSGKYLGYNLDGRGKLLLIHRLVAIAFVPNPLEKKFVNHKDGNKLNNHASNLEWVTRSENMQHASGTGLLRPWDRRGSKHPLTTLTDADVVNIRTRYANGEKISALARERSLSVETVRHIVKRFTWKHIP